MENLPRAPANVRRLNRFTTRRTSIASFLTCLEMSQNDRHNTRLNIGQLLPIRLLRRLYSHLRFTFRMLRQRSTTNRRFPRNSQQVWAYYCLPLEQVSNELDVSEDTLIRRANNDGFDEWPLGGDSARIMIAAQFWNGMNFARSIFPVPRNCVFEDLLNYLRNEFHLHPYTIFMIYYESAGGSSSCAPRGPILNNEDWRMVAEADANHHRVSLLMVEVH